MNTRNHSFCQLQLFSKPNDQTLPIGRASLIITLWLTLFISVTWSTPVTAQQVVVSTKKNLQYEGELFPIEKYSAGAIVPTPFGAGNLIVVIDDGLRRVFIGQNSVDNADGESQRNEIEFDIPQKEYNGSVGTNGQLLKLGQFNEFGHRDFFIRDAKGSRRYVQGITKITPRYCIVNVLTSGRDLKQWRMSVATNMIDPQILRGILVRRADPNNVNDLFDIADFFRQTQNYEMARKELLLSLIHI